MTQGRYRTPNALRTAVDTKLREIARLDGRPFRELRREFLHQRLLARIFDRPDVPWVLRGGVGLMTRLPGARHSPDVDLVHLTATPPEAEAELREIGRRDQGDHLRFEVTRSVPLAVPDLLKVKTAVHVGDTLWETFEVDIACERHFVDTPDLVPPVPVLRLEDVPEPPPFLLYPVTDQIADKVGAMYERYGPMGAPSSRYRDLVDLVFLVGLERLDAELLTAALRSRERHTRNPVTLPRSLGSPGPGWDVGYALGARWSSLPPGLHDLDAALGYVGVCLTPVLDGTVTSGSWDPLGRIWSRVLVRTAERA